MKSKKFSYGPVGTWFVIATIAVVLPAAAVVCEASSWHEETVQKSIAVKSEAMLVIITKSGDITVTGEEGKGEVDLHIIKKVKAEDAEEAQSLASMMTVEIVHDGELLRIQTEYPHRKEGKRSILSYLLDRYPKMQMELVLTVPAELALEIETASGDVSIHNMLGEVDVTAASGDVETDRISGDLVVHVASGDIDVSRIGGDAKLVSASGDITAREMSRSCFINTASGDIDLSNLGGDLEIRSVTGDATVDGVGSVEYSGMSGSVRFVDVRGAVSASAASGDLSLLLMPVGDHDYTIRTSSGGIKVRFLTAMAGGYILKATTTSGDIEAMLPINISKVGRNHVAGIVRDGKSTIILETASGDISISEPEE